MRDAFPLAIISFPGAGHVLGVCGGIKREKTAVHARRYPQSGQNAFHPDPGPRRAGREKRLHIEAKMHGRARGGASARPMAIRHADGRNQSPGAEAARLSPPWQVLPGHPSSSARVARCGWRREPLPRPARLPLRRSTDLPFAHASAASFLAGPGF